jgi:signal transduction histidine kinase
LVLLNGDEYGLIAVASTDHTSMSVRVYRESKGNSVSLPTSMLNYVRRTQERVLLNDGKQAHPFWNDAYLSSRRPKSVLCLPVLRKSTVIGLLYVENNLVADGFSPDRVEVLEILAAQAAISLENSLLYDRLQQENVDRKIAEAQVRKLNDELERRVEERTAELSAVNGELESFSYSVSHDLRTPLRSINALGSLLMAEHGDHLNAEGQDYIRRLRAATERMGNLIDALLDLSRVTRAPLNTVKLDLSKIAAEIVFELQSRDPDRTVTTSITPGLRAVGDPRLVRSVLENLIGNAWKYSKNVSAAQIEFGMEDERTFFVRDNGAGFEMSYADKLFLPFSRLHAESEFKGAGIGLATVKRIVERHGGEIWAQASPMTGATFYFTLSRE